MDAVRYHHELAEDIADTSQLIKIVNLANTMAQFSIAGNDITAEPFKRLLNISSDEVLDQLKKTAEKTVRNNRAGKGVNTKKKTMTANQLYLDLKKKTWLKRVIVNKSGTKEVLCAPPDVVFICCKCRNVYRCPTCEA